MVFLLVLRPSLEVASCSEPLEPEKVTRELTGQPPLTLVTKFIRSRLPKAGFRADELNAFFSFVVKLTAFFSSRTQIRRKKGID